MDRDFDVVSPETIAEGRATDAYFERTVEALEHADENPHVVAEVTADQFSTGAARPAPARTSTSCPSRTPTATPSAWSGTERE